MTRLWVNEGGTTGYISPIVLGAAVLIGGAIFLGVQTESPLALGVSLFSAIAEWISDHFPFGWPGLVVAAPLLVSIYVWRH